MSSYYGSPPGSVRSSYTSDYGSDYRSSVRSSTFSQRPVSTVSAFEPLTPPADFDEYELPVPAIPAPLKTARAKVVRTASTKSRTRTLQSNSDPQRQKRPRDDVAPPSAGQLAPNSHGMPKVPTPSFTPTGNRPASPYVTQNGSPSPFVDRKTPSPSQDPGFSDKIVSPAFPGYSDKIVSPSLPPHSDKIISPQPATVRSHQRPQPPFAQPPHARSLSPLPESREIALPPGVQLRPDTPDQIIFHPDDDRAPTDQVLFPPPDRPITPNSAFRASPDSALHHPRPRHKSPAPSTINEPLTPGYASSMRSLDSRSADPNMPKISSPYTLNGLWNAAQGAIPTNGDGKVYILKMYRQAPDGIDPLSFPEHFTFGPALNSTFFSLKSEPAGGGSPRNKFNEVVVRRKNPASGDSQSVARMQLSRDGCPAEDGLVTLIYPKRAVIQAIASPHLPDTQKTKAAVNLAAEKECCRLEWSTKRKRYELVHPAMISSNKADDPALVIKIVGAVGFDNLGARGRINLVNMTNKETLAALDFARHLMFVNTSATMKIPSMHSVDVVVSTLLAVATAEGRRNRAKQIVHSKASVRSFRTATPATSHYARSVRSPAVVPVPANNRYVEKAEVVTNPQSIRRKSVPSPAKVAVKLCKGVWLVIYFTARLPYEIVKAIVDAFRPVPEDRSRQDGGGRR